MTVTYKDAINFMHSMYIKPGGDMTDKTMREQILKILHTVAAQFSNSTCDDMGYFDEGADEIMRIIKRPGTPQYIYESLCEFLGHSKLSSKHVALVAMERITELEKQLAEAKEAQMIPLSPKFWRKVKKGMNLKDDDRTNIIG